LKHELASLQQRIDTPTLLSIRAAAKAALEGCSDLRFDFDEGRVMVEFTDGHAMPFEHLSDGQRTMLGLFCDLARRAAMLNPHFGGDASARTSGVVLIDELDLHLHPKWQRRIIQDLRRTFPKVQFICTTHSPQLIGQVKPEEIIVLDAAADHPSQSLGMDSNWVLRHIQGSDDRDPVVAAELDAIFEYIDQAHFEQAQQGVDTLRSRIGEHPELVEAQALIGRYTRFDTSASE
jgi:predicted ATP-binding protein involved in virulence